MSSKLENLWKQSLNILKEEISSASFETWLKSTYLLSHEDNKVQIAVPNEFAKEWLETRYSHLIRNTLQILLNEEVDISFMVTGSSDLRKNDIKQNTFTSSNTSEKGEKHISTKLNPKYKFNSFVIGNSNRFAHAACLAVAQAPASSYNPLFIYGGVGLGKTHLMHAIGHHVLDKISHQRVTYVSSENFTNELINSIRDDKTAEFRNKYRNIDVLLVDDIQFLAGKERTQEEFFHTFNTLHEADKQIILSSDRPPQEIPTLEDRLRSRFEWGLITDIQPPDFETRLAILKKKAAIESVYIPDEVLNYIAEKINTNIRKLEGALLRITAYTSVSKQKLTKEFAANLLKDIIPKESQEPLTIEYIQRQVANHFNIEQHDLKAKKRTRLIAHPRQIAMYLSRNLTESSLPAIGDAFGGRDHTTVMHACEKISKEIENNASFKKDLESLKNKIINR